MSTRSPVYDGNSDLIPNKSQSARDPTSASKTETRKSFRYRTFRCPVCHTEFSVTKEDVGKTFVCPDCETKVVAPADLNFEIETDYERLYYNDDKKRRDELLSPLRNPNREGIDLEAKSVYTVQETKSQDATTPNSSKKTLRYVTFPCPLCHTEFSVSKEDVGKTLICPDCETKVVVPNNLQFDVETDYERLYFNAAKLRRDVLLSPIRNPNRDGIDLEAQSVYTVKESEVKSATSTNKKANEADSFPVRCRVCETLMRAPREMLGKKIRCPDCGTETIVTDALKLQQEGIDVKFDPQDRGVYDIGEIPEEPPLVVQGSDGRHIVVDKNTNTLAPDRALRDAFAQGLLQNQQRKKKKGALRRLLRINDESNGAARENQAGADVVQNLCQNEKNLLTLWLAWREKRRKKRESNVDAEDLKRFLPPLVLRPRNGELVWTLPSPPKKAPLFNKTFRAICSEEIWTRGALIAIAFVALAYLMCDWIIPAAGIIAVEQIGSQGRMFAEAEMALGIAATTPIVLCASSLIGLFFWSVFGAGNSGASRVVDWRGEDILGFLGYGVWFATLVAVAFLPGLLTVSCLDLTLKGNLLATWNGTATTSLTDVLRSSAICWGSFWLFFPIFWLSTTQTDWPFCPINGRVFTSFFSQFVVWQQFYAVVALCFYVPSVLWSLLATKGLWFWRLAPVWTLLVPMIFGLLLGRLSWILDDEVRSMDFDD